MSNNLKDKILNVWVNACRLLLAMTFIFSGFVKAVDPMGSVYKISDYLTAFGWDIFPDYMIRILAVALSSFEFFLGINLLLAIRRKITTGLIMLFMLVMTPLTLYLAIANPVSDCGCFGDAVKLTNWETFWKNIILLVFAVSVLKWNTRMFRIMTWRVQWIVSIYSLVFIVGISVYCLNNLPVFDFRPYKTGTDIKEAMSIPEGAELSEFKTTFILEKNGIKKEFTLEDYPTDTTWKFIDSKTVVIKQGYEPPIQNFSISLLPEEYDITDEILNDTTYTFLMIMPSIEKASDTNIDRINDLYDYCLDNGYKFYCLTASQSKMIKFWKEYMGAEYQFCLTDETTLKTIVRSNPGMMLLKNGIIINKWHHKQLPTDEQLVGRLENTELGKTMTNNDLRTTLYIILLYIIPLAIIIGIEAIWLKANNIKTLE